MDALRCPPADKVVDVLSGGERRRVALCRLLLKKPDILLLDEPTNHLDAETVAWLEKHLREYEGTVIAVTHDRYFLDNVAGWILELDRGEGIPWKGNYSSWLDQKAKQLEMEEKGESSRAKTLERELEWVQMSPKGRHAKSKARIERYEKLVNEEGREKVKETRMMLPVGPRLGNVVIKAEGIAKSYDDKLLYEGLSFEIPPGAIVGLIGPNGAGKTTLLRMITGEEKPDAGTIKLGDTVKLGYADQMRKNLDPEKSVWEQLSGGLDIIKLGKREVPSRAYCSWFNFSGTDQSKKVGVLSGGERNRLNMAMMVQDCANVLLLDEPTNDLDVNTMRALEEALDDFAGAALVVSHDRWFLDRVCTHILAFEGNSEAIWYDGNFTEFMDWRRSQLGNEADRPHRIVYRKLER
jgi:ATP-binding cassette ChvD family protein